MDCSTGLVTSLHGLRACPRISCDHNCIREDSCLAKCLLSSSPEGNLHSRISTSYTDTNPRIRLFSHYERENICCPPFCSAISTELVGHLKLLYCFTRYCQLCLLYYNNNTKSASFAHCTIQIRRYYGKHPSTVLQNEPSQQKKKARPH